MERGTEASKLSSESARLSSTKKDSVDASVPHESVDKASKDSVDEPRMNSESVAESTQSTESKEDERSIAEVKERANHVTIVSGGNPGLISRRGRKRSSSIKGGTRSFVKGMAALDEGSLEDEELALFRLLSAHLSETLSLLTRDPRQTSLASFPAINDEEQQAIDQAVQTIWDAPRFADLELASFAHLTSPPVTSTMERSRSAMFGQVGFTLKAPADHEAYMMYSLQRLAASHNAKFIDFDLRLLRESESIFTESLLQNEEKYSSAALFFQDLLQDEEDFELFFIVLFEYIHRASTALITPAPASSTAQEAISDTPATSSSTTEASPSTLESTDIDFIPSSNGTFVVAIRGMDQFQSFPHRKFKELLRICNKNVLFVEVETANQASQAPGSVSLLGGMSHGFMIAPSNLGGDEDDMMDGNAAASGTDALQSFLSKLSGGRPQAEKNGMARHFLGDHAVDFTHRKIIEAEKIRAEDAKKAAHEGSMRLAGRFNPGGRVVAEGSSSSDSRSTPGHSTAQRRAILKRADEAQSALEVLARRELLQQNLKVLSAAFRGINVMVVPDGAIQDANKSATTALVPPIGSVTGNSIEEIPTRIDRSQPDSDFVGTSSKPYVRMWHPLAQCLSDYWLNPTAWKGPKPESFETTLQLLSLFSYRMQTVERIVHRAIKLQDKYQFQKTGTWNHFSPTVGTLIRMAPIDVSTVEAENAANIDANTSSLLASLYGVQENTAVRMPLEIAYLHDSLRVELNLDERFESLPFSVRRNLPKNLGDATGSSQAMAASRLYFEQLNFKAQAVQHHLWTAFNNARAKIGVADKKSAQEVQAAREKSDEENLQYRLKGLTLNSAEKSMLQNYVAPSRLDTTFDDIGSLEHAKEELLSLMVPMSLPVFQEENKLIKTPLGILLYGPPGTGKTMLAKALAKTANASFIHISASSIVAKWLGESEGHAAAVFSLAKKLSPAIVFLDEVDGLLNTRDNAEHETSRRMKNEIFSGWDGLLSTSLASDPNLSVTVVAATNRPYDLDSAALRRLPHRVLVNLPNNEARVEIIRKTLRGAIIAPDGVSADQVTESQREQVISELARLTEGYSGSDIKSVCTRAAQQHVRDFMKAQNVVEMLQGAKRASDARNGASELEEADMAAEAFDKEEKARELLNEKARAFAKRPLTIKEFNIALGDISASVNQRTGSALELKKWHETYGSSPAAKRAARGTAGLGF